jgi:hypothetical protein
MNYAEIIAEASPPIGTLTQDLPKRFFHFTHDQSMVDAIAKNGFDLNKFGFTGKKFNMPDLTKYDPAGVYCQDAAEIMNSNFQPWVIFELIGHPTALASRHVFFKDLAEHYGCVGKRLSQKLLQQGIQVVQNVREFVILDTKIIHILDWSKRP